MLEGEVFELQKNFRPNLSDGGDELIHEGDIFVPRDPVFPPADLTGVVETFLIVGAHVEADG